MLVIRQQQMDAMNARLMQRFEAAETARIAQDFPEQYARLGGADAARRFVRDVVKRATDYEIYAEPDLSTFIDIAVKNGKTFEERDDLAWAAEILRDRSLGGDTKVGLIAGRLELQGM